MIQIATDTAIFYRFGRKWLNAKNNGNVIREVLMKNNWRNKMFTTTEITHRFHAQGELVFKAFTESEQLKHWWGPKGWAFDISKFELRQEGVFHYSQTPPDGHVMWVKFVYHEIHAPEKLVYSSFFSDEKGNVIRAPFNDNSPLETLNNFTFIADGGKTILRIWHLYPQLRRKSTLTRNHKKWFRRAFQEPLFNWPIISQLFQKTNRSMAITIEQ